MLFAEVVESAMIAPLQHGPEALHTIGGRHPAYILTGGVANRLVIEGHPLVCTGLIGEHLGTRCGVLGNETL